MKHPYPRNRTRALLSCLAAGLAATIAFAGCASTSGGGGSPSVPGTLTVVTHDSFSLSDELRAQFEASSGLKVTYVAPGDAGTLVNQLVLTKDSPLGDVVYGIDNTYAGRALSEGVIEAYASSVLPPADASALKADDSGKLTPIDFGDTCINADTGWFARHGIAVPKTLDDLTKPAYKDLLVISNPASSSPGMAFLTATVGAKGDPGYLDYWSALKANGVLIAKGWTEAYSVQFSGSTGKGPRPLVLSYSTSPAAEIKDGVASTQALLQTCFRQVEYAGVLTGAKNPKGAKAFIDFLLSAGVQADIPNKMYMYPAVRSTQLPADWAKFAPLSQTPFEVPTAQIAAGRDRWIRDWTAKVVG